MSENEDTVTHKSAMVVFYYHILMRTSKFGVFYFPTSPRQMLGGRAKNKETKG